MGAGDVTVLHSDGKTCGAPSLPIWLADHVSVFDGSSVLTCGGRSNKETTLCWHLHLNNSSRSAWVRAPEMLEGRSYADAVESGGDVWVTGGWDGKVRRSRLPCPNPDSRLRWSSLVGTPSLQ